MRMPGFNADASLYTRSELYDESELTRRANGAVEPTGWSNPSLMSGATTIPLPYSSIAWAHCLRAEYYPIYIINGQWYGGGLAGYYCDPSLPGCEQICK